MNDDLRAYIFSQGLLLPSDDYLAILLDPIVLELQAPLPPSEAIDEDDVRSIAFWDQRRWEGWMRGIDKEVWEDKLEVKAELMQRVRVGIREVKRGHWSKLSELMDDEEDAQVFRFPNRLEDDYLLSRVARRRGATFESELPMQHIIDKQMIMPPLLEVEDDGDLLRMLDMPEIEDGLDLRLPTTADQITYLKKMTRSIKAMSRLTTEQMLAESDEAEADRPLQGLDIDSYRIPSPPLLPRTSLRVADSPQLELVDVLEVITPPSSPRGLGVSMDAWNREEGIRSFPPSPVRFSRDGSRPIWSSPPTSEQPEIVFELMEIDKPLFPRAKRGRAATTNVEMPPVPLDSNISTSDDDIMMEVLAGTTLHISELLTSDDTIGSEQSATDDLAKLRLRVPHLSTPTLPPPPPPPGLEDFASTSPSSWSLKVDRGLTSATIGLSWAVDRRFDGQKLNSIVFDDDSAELGDLQDAQKRGAALLAETKDTEGELADEKLDERVEYESKINDMAEDVFLQPRAPVAIIPSHPTLPEPARAQSMPPSSNRFTQITAFDLDMSKIPSDLVEAVKSTTSSSSPLSRLSPGLGSSNPASDSRSSPPPAQEPGQAHRSLRRIDAQDDVGLRDIIASRLRYRQEASNIQATTKRLAAFDQFLSTRGQRISNPPAVPSARHDRREVKQNVVTAPLPTVDSKIPRSPPYQDIPFPRPQFLQADDEIRPLSNVRVIGFHSLFQNRTLCSALQAANIELVHRYSRWKEDRYRTLDPHLILDSHTCAIFRPLWSLVGRAYRPEEVDNTSTSTDFMREEAFFTTLYRIPHRFDRILVVLTERWPKTSSAVEEYTQPVLKALRELDQGILEHLTGRDDRVRIEVVFSKTPEESGKIVRKLLVDLRQSDHEDGECAAQFDPLEWLADPSEDEAKLLQLDTINEFMTSQILSQCSAVEFFQLDEATRQARFAGIIGAERMIEVERCIEELRMPQDTVSQLPRADDAPTTLTGIAEVEASSLVLSDESLTSFQELIFDFDA